MLATQELTQNVLVPLLVIVLLVNSLFSDEAKVYCRGTEQLMGETVGVNPITSTEEIVKVFI